MSLPYPTKVVLPFDIATAQDMNERHANDEALANGSGLDNGAVTATKIDFDTFTPAGALDGFIEQETFTFNGVTVPANSWLNTGSAIDSKYLSGDWKIIAAEKVPSAGLYFSYLLATGAIYINSTRPANVTVTASITYIYIKLS
jgi:hypothetical protein